MSVNYKELGLVNTEDMFKKAMAGKYAIPAYNVNNMEQLQAIIAGCVKSESPVIIQVSRGARQYANQTLLRHMLQGAVELAREMGGGKLIPIAVHLDHGDTYDTCKSCVDTGFSSVMIDGSHLPYDENVAETKRVVDYAHKFDVTVEGELGVLAGIEEDVVAAKSVYTQPEQVEDFLSKTGVDSLAISIGTSHGANKFTPEQCTKDARGILVPPPLRFDILEEIERNCEDETFHPEICLVAIEPVSNFILVERYAADRKTKTWDKVVHDALDNLPVEVIQVASDEGRSLISHALKGLKVHHSPDCFHVIYEIGRGTCGALMSKVRKAEKGHENAIKQILKIECKKEKFDGAEKRPRGRRPHFEERIKQAKQEEEQIKEDLQQTRLNYETVRNAKAEIGKIYHPYNLKTGQKQDSETVSELLSACFAEIHNATTDLSDRCKERVNKAQRVMGDMVATIAFFFKMIDIYLENMQLSDHDKRLMTSYLIPGHYLKLAANKERDVDRKADLSDKAQELLSIVNRLEDLGEVISDCEIEKLEKAARDCAQIFQRSSSCVEGRNAQLALRHQGIHRLSNRHLQALTVMHNYYVRRRDGTTAAERLFEAKPNDLFEFLLDRMDYSARPRNCLKLAA